MMTSKSKQNFYKTAYSPMYEQYVRIVDSWQWKGSDTWYFSCYLAYGDSDQTVTFTEDELTNFCL